MYKYLSIFILSSILSGISVLGQEIDSTSNSITTDRDPGIVAATKPDKLVGIDTTVVIRAFLMNPVTFELEGIPVDTSFNPAYNYNPIFKNDFSNTFLGNSGLAAITNDFSKRNYNHPFVFAIPYTMYLNKPENIIHYNTRKPFSELKYLSSGTKDDSEQIISAVHTQNVNEFVNVGLLYNLIASKGMYLDQNVSTNRLNLYGSYDKDNYSFFTSLHYNGYKAQENGGLVNIDDFKNQSTGALNFPVQLSDASSRFKNMDLFFTQKLNLKAITEDSARSEYLDNFAFHHTINYNRFVKTYTDEISSSDSLGYYSNNYYLINEAYDSAFYQNLSNRFDLSVNLANESQEFRVYAKHELKTYSYAEPISVSYIDGESTIDSIIRESTKETFNDISVGGQYIGKLKTWNYTANGQLFLTGYNIGDLIVNGYFIKYFSNKQRYLKLSGELSSLKPSYFLSKYSSSHFNWNNDFTKIETTKAGLEYSGFRNFNTRLSLSLINDFIYFNSEAVPVQYSGELFVATGELDKTFKLGIFKSRNQLLYQISSADVVSLPALAYRNKSWLDFSFFKEALILQLGAELYYFTEYKGDAYMAATGQFYSQDDANIGNYPFVTGFINAKIARTRFTIQYTNALGGLMKANYFMAYRYPNFSETLKFGLAWTFYD